MSDTEKPLLELVQATPEDKAERADQVYARYRSAMLFFGQKPAPQVKVPRG